MIVKIVTPHKYFADRHDEWLKPAFPEWFKSLRYDRATQIENTIKSSRECPAFVHMFKNAHLICAPMDMSFNITEDGRFGWKLAQESDMPFNRITSFNFEKQMGKEWGQYLSLKIDFQANFVPDESTQCMFVDPMYHIHHRTGMTAMTGVWPMHPKLYTILGVNLMVKPSVFENGFVHLDKGTPLAYLYWPNGKPKIEVEVCNQNEWRDMQYVETHFKGDFLKKEKELHYAV